MSNTQDMWIDLYIPYSDNEYVGTELATEVFEAISKSGQYPLNNTQGEAIYPWITLDHNEDSDDEDLQYDFFTQIGEFSKKYPEILFQVDTYNERFGYMRVNFLNGEDEDVEVVLTYGKSKWQL